MSEWIFINPAYREALSGAGLGDFDAWMNVAREAERATDRGESIAVVEIAGSPGSVPAKPAFRVYLKRYRATGCSPARALRRSRLRREAENLIYLRTISVPTADVVAAGERRRGGCATEAFVATKEIIGARALTDVAGELGAREKIALIETLARAVRRMHDSGYVAHDLYARNVLVTGQADGSRAVWLIDHPRGGRRILFRRCGRIRDLACLRRDLPETITRVDLARFVKCYLGVPTCRDDRAARLMRAVEKRKKPGASR